MKTVRTLVVCLSLIIAGVLFNTGSAYATGPGSKGGDESCTTQRSIHGNPIVRCAVLGNRNTENGAAQEHDWHRHHHRFYRSWHCHHVRRHHTYHRHNSYHHHR